MEADTVRTSVRKLSVSHVGAKLCPHRYSGSEYEKDMLVIAYEVMEAVSSGG